MPARSLAVAVIAAVVCLAIPLLAGNNAADARQRAAGKSQPQTVLPPNGSIETPAAKTAIESVRSLTCRQYVAAAGTTIAVACPDPLPRRHSTDDGDATDTAKDTKPKPSRPATHQPTRTAVGAKGCRHFLPSIGETIAVDCDDSAEPVADAAPSSAVPAQPPPAATHAPIPKRPVVMADNAMPPIPPSYVRHESEGERDRRCDAAIARASLGTVASGNLAELRRGC